MMALALWRLQRMACNGIVLAELKTTVFYNACWFLILR